MNDIEINLLHPDAKVPQYATPGSAAVDLCALEFNDGDFESVIIGPGSGATFSTGIAVNISNPNIVGIVEGRSGLRFNHCVSPLAAGIIDSDYHGEIKVHLYNHGDHDYFVHYGDRIAQLLFVPVIRPNLMVVSEFSAETERGVNGFGSTGK